MATQGTAVVDFSTGKMEATVAVTGQGAITTANLVEAWPILTETVGSQVRDDAWVEQMQVFAYKIVAGTGFTILAKPAIRKAYGTYNIGWVWN